MTFTDECKFNLFKPDDNAKVLVKLGNGLSRNILNWPLTMRMKMLPGKYIYSVGVREHFFNSIMFNMSKIHVQSFLLLNWKIGTEKE